MRTYRITRRGANFTRFEELRNGRPSGIGYRGPRFDRVGSQMVPRANIVQVTYTHGMLIQLTEKGAHSLRHLGLVPDSIPIIGREPRPEASAVVTPQLADVDSDAEEGGDASESGDVAQVVVPDNWESMKKEEKLALASEIAGRKIKTAAMAREIIEQYLEG